MKLLNPLELDSSTALLIPSTLKRDIFKPPFIFMLEKDKNQFLLKFKFVLIHFSFSYSKLRICTNYGRENAYYLKININHFFSWHLLFLFHTNIIKMKGRIRVDNVVEIPVYQLFINPIDLRDLRREIWTDDPGSAKLTINKKKHDIDIAYRGSHIREFQK